VNRAARQFYFVKLEKKPTRELGPIKFLRSLESFDEKSLEQEEKDQGTARR
jgi:hypothetical protein